MQSKFKLILATLCVALSLVAGAPKSSQTIDAKDDTIDEDLVEVVQLPRAIKLNAGSGGLVAPESRIVAVAFEPKRHQVIQYSSVETGSAAGKLNKTKQSQDFDVSQQQQQPSTSEPSSSTVSPGWPSIAQVASSPATPSAPQPHPQPQASSQAPVASSTTTSSPASSSSTTTLDPDFGDPNKPVGTQTIRSGDAVTCGEANPSGNTTKELVNRIIGGRKTEPGEFPFQVRLNIRSRRGSGICGGVVIDSQHILTAAHCMTSCQSQQLTTATIETTGVHATIGDHAIRYNDGEQDIDVEEIKPHEKYDACNFYANDHDIALIKASKPFEYKFTSDGYGSINRPCMPPASDIAYKDGELAVVSGWGVTRENSGSLSNILRYVQVPLVNVTQCQSTYGSRVTNDHVCAGFMAGGKDSCQGDSGGPLVRIVDNRYELVGIVSFGYGCGQPGAPGVYTKVASYLDWIKANL